MKWKQSIEIEEKFIKFEMNKMSFEWVEKNIIPIKDFYLTIGIMLYWFNFLNLCLSDSTRTLTAFDTQKIYLGFFERGYRDRDGLYELLSPTCVCFRRGSSYKYSYPSISIQFTRNNLKNSVDDPILTTFFYYNRRKE